MAQGSQHNIINDQASLEAWVREQFQRANAYLAKNGILFDSVINQECRYMAPILAIWKIKGKDGQVYWVVCGDMPVDYVKASVATNAREAVKHFSLSWQLKAESVLVNQGSEQTQIDYANFLIEKADKLYEAQNTDKWWT